jgi:hypothetical protein
MRIVVGLLLLVLVALPRQAAGQGPLHLGLSFERVGLSGFYDTSTPVTALVMAWELGSFHSVEISAGRLRESQKQRDWAPRHGEAPTVVGILAYPVKASYVFYAPRGPAPVRPFVRVGGDWVRITDKVRSDTPTERYDASLLGAHSAAGVRLTYRKRGWLSLSGEYRVFRDPRGRPTRSMDLDGWTFGLALGIIP